MEQPRFIKYIPTPNDKWNMLGIAEVLVNIPMIVRYKHIKTKDGSGSFYCPPSLSIEDASGEKKHLSGFEADVRKSEEELLQDFIRSEVNKYLSKSSIHQGKNPTTQQQSFASAMTPHAPLPTSMSDLAENEAPPF